MGLGAEALPGVLPARREAWKAGMMERETLEAQHAADALFDAHALRISATVYTYGQHATVMAIRSLADLIESSEFTYQTGGLH